MPRPPRYIFSSLVEFELVSETVAHENPFFQILDRVYRLPDGREEHYYVRKEVDTCCVLAMTQEGQFIVEKQYRVGSDKVVRQLPAGRLEGFDDDPDHRMEEELLEETGYKGQLKKVAETPTSPYSNRTIHVYYATNCERVAEPQLDDNEFIEVELLSADQMEQLLLEAKSSSCAPGLLAWEWLKKDGHLTG